MSFSDLLKLAGTAVGLFLAIYPSFMSVRALARPFIDKKLLGTRAISSTTVLGIDLPRQELIIRDCKAERDATEWYDLFVTTVDVAKQFIRKQGFIDDIGYFSELLQRSRNSSELVVEVADREGKAALLKRELSNEPKDR